MALETKEVQVETRPLEDGWANNVSKLLGDGLLSSHL